MRTVDGSAGEGGGQILRTALSLSAVTGEAIRVESVRARRDRPGLRRQHLAALRAAAEVTGAEVEGDAPGSTTVVFRPGAVRPGRYAFSTGGAGSAPLVLQTVVPPLLGAGEPSVVAVEGGTHNPWAPPFPFLDRAFGPLLRRMGARIEMELERPGFYPAGGGRIRARIGATDGLRPLELRERGPVRELRATALVSALPRHIAEREIRTVQGILGIDERSARIVEVDEPEGPGNAVWIEVESAEVTEVFTGFGRKGVPAEEVAEGAARDAAAYLDADVPVGPRLADQLLVPLAVAGGGVFRTVELTPHARTNAGVVDALAGVEVRMDEEAGGSWRVEVGE